MSNSTLRFSWVAFMIAALTQAPRAAGDDSQPPGQPPSADYPQGPGYGPPPPYQLQPTYAPPPSGPEEITEFDDTRPIPYGYTKVTRARKGLIIGGAVTFGVTYGVSMFAAAVGEDLRRSGESTNDVSALWLPVVGPFVQATRAETSTGKFFLVQLGLAQTAGAIMLVYGLTKPKTLLVRNDQLSITPMFRNDAAGMLVTGRF